MGGSSEKWFSGLAHRLSGAVISSAKHWQVTPCGQACVKALADALREPLVDTSKDRRQVFGPQDAARAGTLIVDVDPKDDQWRMSSRFWTGYWDLKTNAAAYEVGQILKLHTKQGL